MKKETKDSMEMRDGLSGIMRVRNEANLIELCIDSCIDSLDELIVVYAGCVDDTEPILLRKKKEYPEKLRVYKYEHELLWYGLSKEECEMALRLPEDDPRLYSNFCNFALSKVRYKYAVKIDSDQLYFRDELRRWRNVCAGQNTRKSNVLSLLMGRSFMIYFSMYRRLSSFFKTPLDFIFPKWLVKCLSPYYQELAEKELLKDKAVIALSGINLFIDQSIFVPFDGINIHPPYNGEGDTLIFKVSAQTYFSRHPMNSAKEGEKLSVVEDFNLPARKIFFSGPTWFHLHANRKHCFNRVKSVKDSSPDQFVPIQRFITMTYREVLNKMNANAHTLFQRILFAYVHKAGLNVVPSYYKLLDSLRQSNLLL